MARYPNVKTYVDGREFDAALAELENIDKGTSRLLYLYEKGLVLHFSGRYEQSNSAFEASERLYDDLYTKSVSREIGAMLTSDNLIQYRGERFEAAYIYYYKIMNYLLLSDVEGALVECRRLNNRLKFFAESDDSVYVNDAFLQYLTAMVYLEAGEISDASVSLRAAADAYHTLGERYALGIPASLECDGEYSSQFGGAPAMPGVYENPGLDCGRYRIDTRRGAVNVFLECGHAPYKIEQNIVFPIYKGECNDDTDAHDFAVTLTNRYGEPVNEGLELEYLLRVSFPELVASPVVFGDVFVRAVVDGRPETAPAQVVTNLDAVAFEAFEARRSAIMLKAVTRALVKYLAKEGADQKSETAGWLVNLFNVASEGADVRTWSTLPQTVRMARLVLPEGDYDLEIVIQGPDPDTVETHVVEGVHVRASTFSFLNFRIN
jgi:tetratricopeptide (TPR) repeat protein